VGGVSFRPSGVVPFSPIQNGWTRQTAGDFVELPLTDFFLDEVNNTGIQGKVAKPKTEEAGSPSAAGAGQQQSQPLQVQPTFSPGPSSSSPAATRAAAAAAQAFQQQARTAWTFRKTEFAELNCKTKC
jgi:hypothetical protein